MHGMGQEQNLAPTLVFGETLNVEGQRQSYSKIKRLMFGFATILGLQIDFNS